MKDWERGYDAHTASDQKPEPGKAWERGYSSIAIASILSSLLWMLEGFKMCEEDLLDVQSYGELLGEAIL